ncbi:MAG: hypothetical protein CL572_02160 [Alphaproteobacteria bacterium]|nr:hypothetical protein [Alphaproteobacteria bacterium]|tara:strand:+ start:135 stop:608 length:474 start_codon:yes stop_codon:yes gene_type:complete
MKNNFQNEIEVNLYFIKSDFKEILIRLSDKIFENRERFLVNLNKKFDLIETDKYLWTHKKDSFLPHNIFDKKLSVLDYLVLFEGSYERMEKFQEFRKIIISPTVKISKFRFFEKFMIFSNKILTQSTLKEMKNKLLKNKIKHKIYYEYNSFKWKLVN